MKNASSTGHYMVQLDGLRFIAVLLVMTAHWFSGDVAFIKDITGPAGVNLFFVLSGFLITGILIANKGADIPPRLLLKQFYIRRFLRIFPLFYLVVIVGALTFVQGAREYFFWHISYTSNYIIAWQKGGIGYYSHLWSLCVEEQFYIIFPLLIIITHKRRYLKLFYTLIFLAVVSRSVPYLILNDPTRSLWVSYAFTPGCFDSFAIGAILAYYYRYDKEKLRRILNYKSFFLAFFVLYLICTYFGWFLFTRTLWSVCAFWAIGVAALGKFKGLARMALENRVINYLGRITYGLYVYHYFMPYLFKWIGIQSKYNGVLYFIGAVAIASASWFLFERPFNRLKKHFEYSHSIPSTFPRKWFTISLGINVIFFVFLLAVFIKFEPRLLERLGVRRTVQPAVVMFGDSRVQVADWSAGLNRQDVLNAGIGGATTVKLFDSLNSRVIRYHPKACFIQAGINDIRSQVNLDSTLTAFTNIIDILKANKISVFVNSVIPVSKDPFQYEVPDSTINQKVDELNNHLKVICKNKGVEYLDINQELVENKRFKLKYTLDGVHVNPAGFTVWYDEVKTVLNRYKL